jgi:hypothetical protein
MVILLVDRSSPIAERFGIMYSPAEAPRAPIPMGALRKLTHGIDYRCAGVVRTEFPPSRTSAYIWALLGVRSWPCRMDLDDSIQYDGVS